MTGMTRRGFVATGTLAGAAFGMAPAIVRAQEFPTKQVRVVVPYPAGGGTDLVARLVVPRLADRWKQTVITWNDAAPASGLPVGLFYLSGIVFGVSAAVILLYDLWRVLTGQTTEEELVAVKESEEHGP